MLRRFLRETTAIHLTMSWVAFYPMYEVLAEKGRHPIVTAWG